MTAEAAQDQKQENYKDYVPDYMSVLGGPTKPIEALTKIAQHSSNISEELVATFVAREIYDRWIFATNNVNDEGALDAMMSKEGIDNFLSSTIYTAGFAAALGVDFKVYGDAAKALMDTPHWLNPFAFGSLIFASAFAKAKTANDKKMLAVIGACMAIASVSASFVTAADNDYRKLYTDSIANWMDRSNKPAQEEVNKLEARVSVLNQQYEEKRKRLETGGNNGMHMLGDGTTGNDADGEALRAEMTTLDQQRQATAINLGTAKTNLTTATEKDQVEAWGRASATLTLASWLFIAQLYIALFIEKAPGQYAEHRRKVMDRSRSRKALKTYLHKIEHPDEKVRMTKVRSEVRSILATFAEPLYDSPKQDSAKVDAMFTGETFEKIVKMAYDQVYDMIEPRRPLAEKLGVSGMFGRKAANSNDPSKTTAAFDFSAEPKGAQPDAATPTPEAPVTPKPAG